MQYDFENAPDRSKTDSVKWDVKSSELPMWIADMDFKTAPEIIKAMQQKLTLGAFGYEFPQADYFNAVADWYETEHGCRPHNDWMIFTTGVVPAISTIVRRVSHIGDNVLVQEPVYNIFYNSILNNNRKVLSSDLCFDGKEYSIDFEDLERKLSDPATTLMILCNPHNPIGKVWSKETLKKIGELCIKYSVLVVSDEIHCDLTYGNSYIPFASISPEIAQNSITCIAPTKTFNLAGVQASNIIVLNDEIRKMVNRGINTDEVAEPNAFAALGYDAAKILIEAIKTCESTEADAITAAMQNTSLDCVTGHITFDENRNPVKSVSVIEIKEGQNTLYKKLDAVK